MEERAASRIVAKNIQKARTERGIRQSDIYTATGMAQNNLSRMEKGEHRISIDAIAAIAEAIGVSISELLYGLPGAGVSEQEAQILHLYRSDMKFRAFVDAFLDK